MLTLRSAASLFSLAACLLGLSFTGGASAQPSTCRADAECARGYRCEVIAFVDCTASCREGEACSPAIEGCGEVRACIPGAVCASDADCGAAMVCLERTHASCSGGGSVARPCAPGEQCPEPSPVPPECEEITARACVPKYAAPCQIDTDCGDGFRCVEQQSCGCSGSAGRDAPPPSGQDSGADVAPEECSCAPSGVYRCESLVDVCRADSDCPADWTCEDHNIPTTCADRPASAGDPGDGVACEGQDPLVDNSLCTAPNFSGYVGDGDVLGGGRGEGEDAPPPTTRARSRDDSGGCRVSPGVVPSTKSMTIAGLAAVLLLAGRLGRRRRT